MGKVLVLGIDALDYDYVVRRNFRSFMLKKYGKMFVPEELWLNGVPYTPLVWTAYLTGRRPEEVGVSHVYETSKWVRVLQRVIRWTPLRFVKGKRRFLKRMGIQLMKSYRVRGRTLLDDVPSVGINVPGVSLDERFYEILDLIGRSRFGRARKLAYRLARDVFTQTKTVLLTDEQVKLVFSYVNVLDIVGHLYWVKEPWEVYGAYKFVSNWVDELVEVAVGRGFDVIIISDHGMVDSGDGVTGTHTKYAFWSSTVGGFSLSSPYEFRSKVLEVIGK